MDRFIFKSAVILFFYAFQAGVSSAQGISVSERDLEIYSCDERDEPLLLLNLGQDRVLAVADAELGYGKEAERNVFFFYLTEGFARLSEGELLLVEEDSETRLACTRIDTVWREAIDNLLATTYIDSIQLESVSSSKVISNRHELEISEQRQKALFRQLQLVRDELDEAKKREALMSKQVEALRKQLNGALASAAAKEKRIRELEAQ